MDSSLLARVLAAEPLMKAMVQNGDLAGARLLCATPRPIEAPGYLSDLVGVTLAWTAAHGGPTHAVLKASHVGFGREELPFYQTIAGRLNCPVVPQFFAGGTDEPTGRTWLLLEDLSGSHERPSEPPLPPTLARSTKLVEALAQFHAAGWDNAGWQEVGSTLWQRLRAVSYTHLTLPTKA